jgi:hypothetical protein
LLCLLVCGPLLLLKHVLPSTLLLLLVAVLLLLELPMRLHAAAMASFHVLLLQSQLLWVNAISCCTLLLLREGLCWQLLLLQPLLCSWTLLLHPMRVEHWLHVASCSSCSWGHGLASTACISTCQQLRLQLLYL